MAPMQLKTVVDTQKLQEKGPLTPHNNCKRERERERVIKSCVYIKATNTSGLSTCLFKCIYKAALLYNFMSICTSTNKYITRLYFSSVGSCDFCKPLKLKIDLHSHHLESLQNEQQFALPYESGGDKVPVLTHPTLSSTTVTILFEGPMGAQNFIT